MIKMDSRKLILVTALAFLAIVSIASVSAWDLFGTADETSSTAKTTIAGHDFNIPDGYQKNESYVLDNETTNSNGAIFYSTAESYYKGADDIIYIQVADYSYPGYEANLTTAQLLKSGLGDKETINGHEGLIAENEFDGLKVHAFFYAEDGDCITVITSDDNLFEQIIPEA